MHGVPGNTKEFVACHSGRKIHENHKFDVIQPTFVALWMLSFVQQGGVSEIKVGKIASTENESRVEAKGQRNNV